MKRFSCILFSALAAVAGGCQIKGSLGAGGRGTAPEPPPPQAEASADPGHHGGAAGGADGEGYSADCPNPDNHCLTDDIVFAADKSFTRGYIYVDAARMVREPEGSGQAELLSTRNGQNLVTEHFWATRPASPDDLVVGRLAVMLHKGERGVYRRPKDRKEAESRRWWLARIVNVTPLDRGQVIVSGGHVVEADGIRVIDGDESPTTVVQGDEDAHYLTNSHWIFADKPLPDRGYIYASVGAVIEPPSRRTKNQGHFLDVRTGEALWSGHAWRTRPAGERDVRVGDFVAMAHIGDRGLYRAPKSREEAMGRRWWIAKVVDTSEMFKGVIGVAGGHKVSVDAARVIRRR